MHILTNVGSHVTFLGIGLALPSLTLRQSWHFADCGTKVSHGVQPRADYDVICPWYNQYTPFGVEV